MFDFSFGMVMKRLHRCRNINYTVLAASADLALLVYQPPHFVMNYNKIHHISDIEPIYIESAQTGAQAYICKKGTKLYVVFRGTSQFVDVIADVDVLRSAFMDVPGVLVHDGFLKQFMSLETNITMFLSQLITDDVTKLCFVGHSLGAICTLAAAYYGRLYPNKYIMCHTFGSPRLGNSEFTKLFSRCVDENIRVVNTNDVVTMLPMSTRFRHVNESIVIDDDCAVRYVRKDLPFWRRVISGFRRFDFSHPISDHSCDLYLKRLKDIASFQVQEM